MAYFKASDSANIYYEIHGQGIPIICIHGFSESGDVFRIQKRVLAKKYKLILYDIRGHGKSDIGEDDLSISRLALDLKELISYLEIEKTLLVAWSMGASVCLQYINNFGTDRIEKVCIIDKSPKMLNDDKWNLGLYLGAYRERELEEDLYLLKYKIHDFVDKFIRSMSPDLSEREYQIARDRMVKNKPQVLYKLWKSMAASDYRDMLKKIDIETLLVFGGKSQLYSIEAGEYLRDRIEKSKLVIFPENGHLLILENPRKFNAILDDFIENGLGDLDNYQYIKA